jgi:hypothetical protein
VGLTSFDFDEPDHLADLLAEAELVLTSRQLCSIISEANLTQEDLEGILGDNAKNIGRWWRAEVLPKWSARVRFAQHFGLRWVGPCHLEILAYVAYVSRASKRRSRRPKPWDEWLPKGRRGPRPAGEKIVVPELPPEFLEELALVTTRWFDTYYSPNGRTPQENYAMIEAVRAAMVALPVCGRDVIGKFKTAQDVIAALERVTGDMQPPEEDGK